MGAISFRKPIRTFWKLFVNDFISELALYIWTSKNIWATSFGNKFSWILFHLQKKFIVFCIKHPFSILSIFSHTSLNHLLRIFAIGSCVSDCSLAMLINPFSLCDFTYNCIEILKLDANITDNCVEFSFWWTFRAQIVFIQKKKFQTHNSRIRPKFVSKSKILTQLQDISVFLNQKFSKFAQF